MSQINYKFNNREDFSFYILNAVAHDFIHDFNNYGRMGKILNYIMGLVEGLSLNSSASASAPAPASSSDDIIALPQPPVTSTRAAAPPAPPTDNNPTENILESELLSSQMEDNFQEKVITLKTDDPELAVVNENVNSNIDLYNRIASEINPDVRDTRSTTAKLNVMQKLKDFTQESKFLIIR